MTKLDFAQYPELISARTSRVTAHLESQLRKGPRHHIHSMGETSKVVVQGSHLKCQDRYHYQSVTKFQAWFHGNVFVLSCKIWNVVKSGLDWPSFLQGLNNLKILSPSYLWYCKSCAHNRQSFPVTPSQSSVQAG